MGRQRAFGELELAILSVVRSKGRVTVRDVYEALGGQGGYTTVMTVMSRLADKGELLRERIGRRYEYWIQSRGKEKRFGLLERIKNKIFGGDALAMVSYLIDNERHITEKELKEIRKLIDKKRKK